MKNIVLPLIFLCVSQSMFGMEQTYPSLDEDSEEESEYLTNQEIAEYFKPLVPQSVVNKELLQLTKPTCIDQLIKPRGKKQKHLVREVTWYLDQFCSPDKNMIMTRNVGGYGEDRNEVITKYNDNGDIRGYVYQDRCKYITQKLIQLLQAELDLVEQQLEEATFTAIDKNTPANELTKLVKAGKLRLQLYGNSDFTFLKEQ